MTDDTSKRRIKKLSNKVLKASVPCITKLSTQSLHSRLTIKLRSLSLAVQQFFVVNLMLVEKKDALEQEFITHTKKGHLL